LSDVRRDVRRILKNTVLARVAVVGEWHDSGGDIHVQQFSSSAEIARAAVQRFRVEDEERPGGTDDVRQREFPEHSGLIDLGSIVGGC
jgi:hypothetical protein